MKRQLISAVFCLSAGFSAVAGAQPAATVQRFAAQPFNTVEVSGPIDVHINGGQAQPRLELSGEHPGLFAAVKQGVLYLGLRKDAPVPAQKMRVKIEVPQLNQLRYAGTGNIVGENLSGPLNVASAGTGTVMLLGKDLALQDLRATQSADIHILGIKSPLLNIDDRSSGKINLGGNMVLHKLNYDGTGPLSIQWINSSKVSVSGSGRGQIFLAGLADELDATLSDQVVMNAQYLHANTGFINTREQARADVWTKDNLSALATKGSNIYYYHDSKMVGGYMVAPGAVIRMTGLSTLNK